MKIWIIGKGGPILQAIDRAFLKEEDAKAYLSLRSDPARYKPVPLGELKVNEEPVESIFLYSCNAEIEEHSGKVVGSANYMERAIPEREREIPIAQLHPKRSYQGVVSISSWGSDKAKVEELLKEAMVGLLETRVPEGQ